MGLFPSLFGNISLSDSSCKVAGLVFKLTASQAGGGFLRIAAGAQNPCCGEAILGWRSMVRLKQDNFFPQRG